MPRRSSMLVLSSRPSQRMGSSGSVERGLESAARGRPRGMIQQRVAASRLRMKHSGRLPRSASPAILRVDIRSGSRRAGPATWGGNPRCRSRPRWGGRCGPGKVPGQRSARRGVPAPFRVSLCDPRRTPGERQAVRPQRPPLHLHVRVRHRRPPRQGVRLHRRLGPRRLPRAGPERPRGLRGPLQVAGSWSSPARSPPRARSTTRRSPAQAIRDDRLHRPGRAASTRTACRSIQHVTRQAAEIGGARRQGARAGRGRPGHDVRLRDRRDARS